MDQAVAIHGIVNCIGKTHKGRITYERILSEFDATSKWHSERLIKCLLKVWENLGKETACHMALARVEKLHGPEPLRSAYKLEAIVNAIPSTMRDWLEPVVHMVCCMSNARAVHFYTKGDDGIWTAAPCMFDDVSCRWEVLNIVGLGLWSTRPWRVAVVYQTVACRCGLLDRGVSLWSTGPHRRLSYELPGMLSYGTEHLAFDTSPDHEVLCATCTLLLHRVSFPIPWQTFRSVLTSIHHKTLWSGELLNDSCRSP